MTRPPALVLSVCCPPVSAYHRLRAAVIDFLSSYMCVRLDCASADKSCEGCMTPSISSAIIDSASRLASVVVLLANCDLAVLACLALDGRRPIASTAGSCSCDSQ